MLIAPNLGPLWMCQSAAQEAGGLLVLNHFRCCEDLFPKLLATGAMAMVTNVSAIAPFKVCDASLRRHVLPPTGWSEDATASFPEFWR